MSEVGMVASVLSEISQNYYSPRQCNGTPKPLPHIDLHRRNMIRCTSELFQSVDTGQFRMIELSSKKNRCLFCENQFLDAHELQSHQENYKSQNLVRLLRPFWHFAYPFCRCQESFTVQIYIITEGEMFF